MLLIHWFQGHNDKMAQKQCQERKGLGLLKKVKGIYRNRDFDDYKNHIN
jgi:hypothetical protein